MRDSDSAQVFRSRGQEPQHANPLSEPCIMVIFGASGDLAKRLLVPALYNLACDGLLSDRFAVLGMATRQLTTESFRENMSSPDQGIRKFHTRKTFDEASWEQLVERFHYVSGGFDDLESFHRLRETVAQLESRYDSGGNVLFYLATSPDYFSTICDNLHLAGFNQGPGWKRIIIEKPFGSDTASAQQLNQSIHVHWDESQIYRVDHYLGKETVQNLLAFRFSNGIFEPLWNKQFIDNIQFNVCEEVDIGTRGRYYDNAGVVRDMMQNHMFQMLAYLCMEPPAVFTAEAIRDEKAKLLNSVRVYTAQAVAANFVRGQYGRSLNADGSEAPGYRESPGIRPDSNTETFAAGKLHIDNWRWNDVPIYLRSGKALWKRGTEIVVEFKKAPDTLIRGSQVDKLDSNRLVFHIQPSQGIELQFLAKVPGPVLDLQNVDMRFAYGNAFNASRYTGYEVMIYSCTKGDGTLFSRSDLVEAAWKIAQPVLDFWKQTPAAEFPNYLRGTWGPKTASEFIKRDGRQWYEVVTPEVLERLPLFKGGDRLLLNSIIMALRADTVAAGDIIISEGDNGEEMYLLCHGEVEVIDVKGQRIETLRDGDFFGEISLLLPIARTASVRATVQSDLFILKRSDFNRILRDHPQFAEAIMTVANARYQLVVTKEQLLG